MDNDSQDGLRDHLYGELSVAYDRFYIALYQPTRLWGYWVGRLRIIGPVGAAGIAKAYRVILLFTFIAGVILSVVSHTTEGLGNALVVGSLFAFGAWMAQAWYLSRGEELRLRNELLSEFQLPSVPFSQVTVARLMHELNPDQPDARYYAAQIKEIINRIKELDRDGRLDGNG